MNERAHFSDNVDVGKSYSKYETVGGVKVPYINVWGKDNQPHPPTRTQKALHKTSQEVSKFLHKLGGMSVPQDIISERFNYGTTAVIVEKYNELDYFPGYSMKYKHTTGVIEDMNQHGYNRHEIARKLGLPRLKEVHHTRGTPLTAVNVMLNEGIDIIWDLIAEDNPTDYYTNSLARVGTGTDTTTAQATNTGLFAGAVFKAMEATFPLTSTANRIDFKGSYGSGDANQAWEEFTVDNGSSPNDNLMRAVTSKGTKSTGETWTLEIQITGS
jgi:hypothetical protein